MILVTGGAGFIGSNIVAALDERGTDVVVCDRLREGDKWRNLAKRRLADVVDPTALTPYLEQHSHSMSAIVHMGAISSTTATDGDLVIETNFRLSCRLFNFAAEHQIPFIYASSAATYGSGMHGFSDTTDRIETLRPFNLYGWSKHLFDRWVLHKLGSGQQLPPQWAGLKFFNVYGPNEYHKGTMQSVVSHVFKAISQGEPARLFKSYRADFTDGGQCRDFVYVNDCVEIVEWLLQTPGVSGILNVGTGAARSFLDLAVLTQQACGIEPSIEFIEMPAPIREKYQYYTQAETGNIFAQGYTRTPTSLEDGIRDYVQHYLMHEDRYR